MSSPSAVPTLNLEQELDSLTIVDPPSNAAPVGFNVARFFRRAEHVFADTATLAHRVENARQTLAVLDADTALCEAPTKAEIDADIGLAVWIRRRHRRQRKKEVRADIAERDRKRRTATDFSRHENRYLRWSDRARAAQHRATNDDALIAMAHQRAIWSSWALRVVVMVGLFWSAVNVGRSGDRIVDPARHP